MSHFHTELMSIINIQQEKRLHFLKLKLNYGKNILLFWCLLKSELLKRQSFIQTVTSTTMKQLFLQ